MLSILQGGRSWSIRYCNLSRGLVDMRSGPGGQGGGVGNHVEGSATANRRRWWWREVAAVGAVLYYSGPNIYSNWNGF